MENILQLELYTVTGCKVMYLELVVVYIED